jgi:glycosyltransferase involved in cell wall biosynthesis
MLWSKAEDTARREYKDKKWIIPFSKLLDWWAISGCRAILISNHWYKFKKPVYYLYPGCHPVKELPKSRKHWFFSYDRWDKANNPLEVLERCHYNIATGNKLFIAGYWHDKTLAQPFWDRAMVIAFKDMVNDLGALSQKEVYEMLKQCWYHIHLPKEPFGMQTLEAMACGCNIVCHQESGVAELFDWERRNDREYLWQQAKKHTWEHYCDTLEKAIKDQDCNLIDDDKIQEWRRR